MGVTIKDNSGDIRRMINDAIIRGLERCGMQGESYAKDLCTVDTGLLRNSITYALSGKSANITTYRATKGDKTGTYSGTAPEEPRGEAVYIGTNVEYAAYIELGTGKNNAGGRPTPWVYQDDKGNWHHTHGQRAQPFLRPALADHKQTYKNILEDELKHS